MRLRRKRLETDHRALIYSFFNSKLSPFEEDLGQISLKFSHPTGLRANPGGCADAGRATLRVFTQNLHARESFLPAAPTTPEALLRSLSILIVDDISAMRSVTKSMLNLLGAERIHQASNGAEALKLLAKERVDLVLSDWTMPVMNGMELLRAIRQEPKWARLPFILITAEADRDRMQQAIQAGVAGVLLKPYTASRLAERIQKIFVPSSPRAPAASALTTAPAAPPAQAPTAAALPRPNSPDGKPAVDLATVLVVDDTPDNLMLMSQILRDHYKVKVANNGDKALSICQSDNPPDLVLLDIMMPGMDGFEVARRLREHPTSETIPVIFVSAMTDDAAKAKGMQLGAVDFVHKPVDPDTLLVRIRNFMRYIDLHRQLQAEFDSMLDTARLRDSMDSMTRHDLKGPLAGVLGLAQALMVADNLTPEQRAQLRTLSETTLDVLDMVTRSTELYRIESGSFVLEAEAVPLLPLLQRQIEVTRAGFAAKAQNLVLISSDLPPDLAISGDSALCRTVFQNLLKNACEAAPPGAVITVQVRRTSHVEVILTNPGAVPHDMRARFFDKFATSGKSDGTGLGTYSAQLMTQAQGGTLDMSTDDSLNTTTLTVTLVAA